MNSQINQPKQYSGVYLIEPSGKVIGQLRDDRPEGQPCLGVFGGAAEGDETPVQTALRELYEETRLRLTESDLTQFWFSPEFIDPNRPKAPAYGYYAYISDNDVKNIEIHEGKGWAYINGPDDPNLIAILRPTVEKLFAELEHANATV